MAGGGEKRFEVFQMQADLAAEWRAAWAPLLVWNSLFGCVMESTFP